MERFGLFQWVMLARDVPGTLVQARDRAIVTEQIEPADDTTELAYTLEVFRDGETLAMVTVPASWVRPYAKVWDQVSLDE